MSGKTMDEKELQQRICRACDANYAYPELKSRASRFYCADCMALPAGIRATFERLNKRIRDLTAQLRKLGVPSK